MEAQIGKLRQGVARLIDSYAEGLIDKDEFEPRITRLRQRLARLEEQRQAGADEAALQTELQLIIGRLEDFATKVHRLGDSRLGEPTGSHPDLGEAGGSSPGSGQYRVSGRSVRWRS